MRRNGRRELLRHRRICNPLSDLVAPEIIGHAIDPFVGIDLGEIAQPRYEAAFLPIGFVHLLDLLRRVAGGTLAGIIEIVEIVARASVGAARVFFLHVYFEGTLTGLVEATLTHRQCHVRGALKDREMGGERPGFLYHLHAGRAGAEHTDALSHKINPCLRPLCGVKAATGEIIQARNCGTMRFRADAGTQHQKLRRGALAALGRDVPARQRVVEACGADAGVEADVCAQAELAIGVLEILTNLVPRGIEFVEVPIAPQFFNRELIQGPRSVAARTGITVPIPHAAKRRRGLVDLHLEAERA